MSESRLTDEQVQTEQQKALSRAEWLAKHKKRLENKRIKKQKHNEFVQQLILNGDITDKSIIRQYIKEEKQTPPPNLVVNKSPSTAKNQTPLQKPTFNKILYYFLTALFYFPGYLYKKYYETNYQRYLAQKKSLEKKPEQKASPKTTAKKMDESNKGPFTTQELDQIYAAAEIQIPVQHDPEPEITTGEEPQQSNSLFSCFDCFFHRSSVASVAKGEGVNFKPGLSRR